MLLALEFINKKIYDQLPLTYTKYNRKEKYIKEEFIITYDDNKTNQTKTKCLNYKFEDIQFHCLFQIQMKMKRTKKRVSIHKHLSSKKKRKQLNL